MNNRITKLFEKKKGNVLSVFCTAGFPKLNDTTKVIRSLEQSGADFMEIGMPFSDPLADGPTIQHSNEVALKNGMNMKLLFEQLKNIRKDVQMPLILMGYLNPVLQFGIENFVKHCKQVGIDGVILPDLPLDEYTSQYQKLFKDANICMIFLITPQTPAVRIKHIDKISSGFIYMVSSNSTTGKAQSTANVQLEYYKKIAKMKLKNPTVIGFGIHNKTTFDTAVQYSNGAIIGSAFIKTIEKSIDLEKDIQQFITSIKN